MVAAVALSLSAWGAAPVADAPRLVSFLAVYDATFWLVGTLAVPQLATE